MHHFIYPSKDTYITDTLGYEGLNFGLDEILLVGTQNKIIRVAKTTSSYLINEAYVTNYCVQGFSGSLYEASIWGSASFATGSIVGGIYPCVVDFSTSHFTGILTGSYESASSITNNFTGSLIEFSGSINGFVDGVVSGSLVTDYFSIFDGSIINFTGDVIKSVWVVGVVTHNNVYNKLVLSRVFSNRALVQFDITAISKSVANGDIVNPKFTLKMNIAREYELPITYALYAFPISESWIMGDGYLSDGGSQTGASWDYRDYQNGTIWNVSGSSYIQSISATQSFDYEVGDIKMDVTNIANAWMDGTVPNNGIVIISSDELEPTSSGMVLYYFSKDTNTIYEPVLDVGWNSGFSGWSWVTGSLTTSSIITSSIPSGISASVCDSGSVSGPIYGTFTGFGDINVAVSSSYSYSFDDSLVITSSVTNSISLVNGVISVTGLSGNIINMLIYGDISGSVISSIVNIYRRCGVCAPPLDANTGVWSGNDPGSQAPGGPWFVNQYNGWDANGSDPWAGWDDGGADFALNRALQYEGHDVYGWGHDNPFDQYDWWEYTDAFMYGTDYTTYPCGNHHHHSGSMCGKVTCSVIMGTLLNGDYSGSVFTSSFVNGYVLQKGILIGNWSEKEILGTQLSSSTYPILPSYPSVVYVTFFGSYINGLALGAITVRSSSYGLNDYGIFDGVFVNGLLAGFPIHAPFSGSILTSSLFYTSSVTYTSMSLNPVEFDKPFVTVIQNIPSTVKAGNIIRVNVFARPEFPIKNFDRQTQFAQFLIPQYLPSGSSYYAIKDNETEQTILDFDEYTTLSCGLNGNYFMLDTTGFPQERYFKLLIKTENSGAIYTFDKNNVFKIVR